MHSCTGILGKQWFLRDIPGVAGIVGRYDLVKMINLPCFALFCQQNTHCFLNYLFCSKFCRKNPAGSILLPKRTKRKCHLGRGVINSVVNLN